MKLMNEFTIDAPILEVWPVLLDIPRVASCLPGATLEKRESQDVYRGSVSAKVGPVSATYAGTAKVVEVDEDDHVMVLAMKARESKGQGLAEATITSRVTADGSRTRVVVETNLNISGAHAQFGRGILENVAGAIIKQFVARLEVEIATGGHDDPTSVSNGEPRARQAAPLDIGMLGSDLLSRGTIRATVAGLVAVIVIGAVITRTRRSSATRSFDINVYIGSQEPRR